MRRGARSIYPQGRWDVAPSPRSAPRLLLIACTEATAGQTLRAGGGAFARNAATQRSGEVSAENAIDRRWQGHYYPRAIPSLLQSCRKNPVAFFWQTVRFACIDPVLPTEAIRGTVRYAKSMRASDRPAPDSCAAQNSPPFRRLGGAEKRWVWERTPTMHCTLSRTRIVRSLALGLTVATALTTTGCKVGGWGASSWTSPGWLSWGKKAPPSTAGIAATKPSTTLPSSTASPSPTTSVAAATPGATSTTTTPSTPNATSTAAAAYPTTPQAFAYPTQPAAAYQTAGATNTVAPTGGYSAGPYSMTSGQTPTAQQSPYAQSYQAGGYGATAAATPSGYTGGSAGGYANSPAPTTWNTTPAYTADQSSSAYGATEASPYSSPASAYGAGAMTTPAAYQQSAPPTYSNGSDTSGYNQTPGSYNQGGYNPGYTPAAAPPAYSQPQSYLTPAASGGYEGQHVTNVESSTTANAGTTAGYAETGSTTAPAAYGSPAPSTSMPSTTVPTTTTTTTAVTPATSTGGSPALPAALTGESGGYRPGSTGRAVGSETSPATSTGNVYQR